MEKLRSLYGRIRQRLSAEQPSQSTSSGLEYTELNGGSVPCPSCNGSGLIPSELESSLIALIPVNDSRLKPRKTWLYLIFGLAFCVIVIGLLFFLLMPKTVSLQSNNFPIEYVVVANRSSKPETSYIAFNFMNTVNISSGNLIPLEVVNVTANIISKFQPWSYDIVGNGTNSTLSLVSPFLLYKKTQELAFNNTVELRDGVAEYCQASFSRLISLYVSLQFDIAVTLRYYYGHTEQVMISTQQQVCCIPTGNCTTNWLQE